VTEWLVQAEPIQLCFPTHTAAMARFFAELPTLAQEASA